MTYNDRLLKYKEELRQWFRNTNKWDRNFYHTSKKTGQEKWKSDHQFHNSHLSHFNESIFDQDMNYDQLVSLRGHLEDAFKRDAGIRQQLLQQRAGPEAARIKHENRSWLSKHWKKLAIGGAIAGSFFIPGVQGLLAKGFKGIKGAFKGLGSKLGMGGGGAVYTPSGNLAGGGGGGGFFGKIGGFFKKAFGAGGGGGFNPASPVYTPSGDLAAGGGGGGFFGKVGGFFKNMFGGGGGASGTAKAWGRDFVKDKASDFARAMMQNITGNNQKSNNVMGRNNQNYFNYGGAPTFSMRNSSAQYMHPHHISHGMGSFMLPNPMNAVNMWDRGMNRYRDQNQFSVFVGSGGFMGGNQLNPWL